MSIDTTVHALADAWDFVKAIHETTPQDLEEDFSATLSAGGHGMVAYNYAV